MEEKKIRSRNRKKIWRNRKQDGGTKYKMEE